MFDLKVAGNRQGFVQVENSMFRLSEHSTPANKKVGYLFVCP